jgi:hypothetical protein
MKLGWIRPKDRATAPCSAIALPHCLLGDSHHTLAPLTAALASAAAIGSGSYFARFLSGRSRLTGCQPHFLNEALTQCAEFVPDGFNCRSRPLQVGDQSAMPSFFGTSKPSDAYAFLRS